MPEGRFLVPSRQLLLAGDVIELYAPMDTLVVLTGIGSIPWTRIRSSHAKPGALSGIRSAE